jgi:hypothetical protein
MVAYCQSTSMALPGPATCKSIRTWIWPEHRTRPQADWKYQVRTQTHQGRKCSSDPPRAGKSDTRGGTVLLVPLFRNTIDFAFNPSRPTRCIWTSLSMMEGVVRELRLWSAQKYHTRICSHRGPCKSAWDGLLTSDYPWIELDFQCSVT